MSSINIESAISIVRDRIDQLAEATGDQFEILLDSTKEIEKGWIFFYNTKEFVRTRDPAASLAGNGPILVTREGLIYELPSGTGWEDAVKKI